MSDSPETGRVASMCTEIVMKQIFWVFFCFFLPVLFSGINVSGILPRPPFVFVYTILVSAIAMATEIGFLFDSKLISFLMCAASVHLVFLVKKR